MHWNDAYKKNYEEIVKKALPAAFVKFYDKSEWLHDRYLVSFYIANTGKEIQTYSKKGFSTLQMHFCTGANEHVLISYLKVHELEILFSKTADVSPTSPSCFGRCIVNTFELCNDGTFWHRYSFEGENTISIRFESIAHRNIVYEYW